MQRPLYCPGVALDEIPSLLKEMAESLVAGILPQSSLEASGSLGSCPHNIQGLQTIKVYRLPAATFPLLPHLHFQTVKKGKHQKKNCVILDLHINFGFVRKSFSKAASCPSLCMMLKGGNKVLGIAQLALTLFPQEWELGAAREHCFLELLIFLFEPPLQENPRCGIYLCTRVWRFLLVFGFVFF